MADVPAYTGRLLTRGVRSRLRQEQPECWSDDFNWLPIANGAEEFGSRFAGFYTHVRAYHACRPRDVGTYLTDGIQAQSAELIEQEFLSLFADAPRSMLESTLTEFHDRKTNERGKLWVVLSEHGLLEDYGHYLIQGSEYMMALAATLTELCAREDYRFRLRNHGTPTVFEAHIPVDDFPVAQIEALARLVLSEWGQRVSRNPLHTNHDPCLTLHTSVPPEHLVKHWHPRRVRDPHQGHVYYINESTTCPYCAR